MEDEDLIVILEYAIQEAVELLQQKKGFKPFAYGLGKSKDRIAFSSDHEDEDAAYESLTQDLVQAAKENQIDAAVLFLDTTIPDSFNIQGDKSIRIHVEHRDQMDKKIAARFLYLPYEIIQEEKGIKVLLSHPKPVAFPHEIFVV